MLTELLKFEVPKHDFEPIRGFNFNVWLSPLSEDEQEFFRLSVSDIDSTFDPVSKKAYLTLIVRLFEEKGISVIECMNRVNSIRVDLLNTKGDTVCSLSYSGVEMYLASLGSHTYNADGDDQMATLKFHASYEKTHFVNNVNG